MRSGPGTESLGRTALVLLAIASAAVSGCTSRPMLEASSSRQLSAEIRAVLGATRSSPEYHRARLRLQQMGPEIDVILVGLVGDTRARVETRADALLLLADRRSPLALPTLESSLQSPDSRIRAASVLGLNRLSATSPEAMELIRLATRDRSRTVRMNAMQSLDVREVETIRWVLERETDTEVRQVGVQLVRLAESRGAPLAVDSRGALRTVASEGEPQIVFRPVTTDSAARVARGDLRVELPEGPDIPLAASAIVVANVVPAFFSADRSRIVVEAGGEIRVAHVGNRTVRNLGAGLAPRPVPFTAEFVFLREPTGGARGSQVTYAVYRASFVEGEAERIGELAVRLTENLYGGESPVRAMVVGEDEDGFVLRGENMDPFRLPAPAWTTEHASFPRGGVPR